MPAPRPSAELSEKINVTASLIRKQEATAEDFKEIADLLEYFADWVDAQLQPSDFYKFHASMEALIAAHPNAPENSWAVIVPASGQQYVAKVINGTWTATQNVAPIQFAESKVVLEQNDGQADVFYIVTDEKLIGIWYNDKYNYFGKDGNNGASAYEVAEAFGFEGTETEWLAYLRKGFKDSVEAAEEKTEPVNADLFGILDSAATFVTKKLSWQNVKATFKTYFDTLYADKKLSNLPSDLTATEQNAIKTKLNITEGGGGTPAPEISYLTVQEMLDDQANQVENKEYTVEDASGWSTVTSGWATFEKKATNTASEEDYVKRENQEQLEASNPGTGAGIQIIDAGAFTGEINMSDGNYRFYDLYDSGNSLGMLQVDATKKVGSQAIIEIKGNLISDVNNFIPNNWRSSGQPLTNNSNKINELRTELLKNNIVAINNRVFNYPDSEKPTAPQNLISTSKTESSIGLTWSQATDNIGVVVYNMKAVKVSDSSEVTAQSNNTTGTLTELVAEESYNITVTAEDAAGNVSDPSNEIQITTDAAPTVIDPSTLSNLDMWFDGTDESTMQLDVDDNIDSITDKTNTYTLLRLGNGGIYNNSLIQFDDAGCLKIDDANSPILLPSQNFHGFFIFKNTSGEENDFMANSNSDFSQRFGIGLKSGNLSVGTYTPGAGFKCKSVAFSDQSNFHVLEFKNINGVVTALLDRTEINGTGTIFSTNAHVLSIGGKGVGNTSTYYKAMDFKELFVKSGEMTAQERTNMLDYINEKHGL